MLDFREVVSRFNEQGFYVLPAVFNAAKQESLANTFDEYWRAMGSPALEGFGMAVHPLISKIPAVADAFVEPIVLDALAAILGQQPRLMHTGARVSSEASSQAIGWHDHYSWDRAGILTRKHAERVLFGCYVRGSTPEIGPLVVLPRKLNDPLLPAPGALEDDWQGQLAVTAAPGSVVIFDTALYHTARRGSRPGHRYLFGAHVQGIDEKRPHPEDNIGPLDRAPVQQLLAENAALRRFVTGS